MSAFLQEFARAKPVEGFNTERFVLSGTSTVAVSTHSDVLRLPDESLVACQDLGVLQATVRSRGDHSKQNIEVFSRLESAIAQVLRIPPPQELQDKKRHAVVSLFLAIVEE